MISGSFFKILEVDVIKSIMTCCTNVGILVRISS